MANNSENKYNELNFNPNEMTLSEKYAAITGMRYFDVNEAINNADDPDAMRERLLWYIPGGRMVADYDVFQSVIEELGGETSGSSDDGSSSTDEGSSNTDDDKIDADEQANALANAIDNDGTQVTGEDNSVDNTPGRVDVLTDSQNGIISDSNGIILETND